MDPISDMFTRIRNAQAVKKETVNIPYSKIKMEIAKALLRSRFIKEINRRGRKNKKTIEIVLLYNESGKAAISRIKRISKPSRRFYSLVSKLYPFRQGFGMRILTTSKGVLTDKEARRERVGGEVICEIW
jgi:small subunit ribosomal protein S8